MNPVLAQLSERLDWFGYGISSVNRTGAFCACVSLAGLSLTAVKGRLWFCAGISANLLFAYFMVQTMSRGAIVAWSCGMAFFICFAAKNMGRPKMAALLGAVAAIFAFSVYTGAAGRFQEFSDGAKIRGDVRSALYIAGLKMLSDAPQGWDDPPQDVYKTWYQDLDKSDNYLSLVNSHLQFMTQHGTALRMLYMGLWIFALLAAFPKHGETFNAAACSVFVCTLVSAVFSNVLNYWVVWIPFAIFLVSAAVANLGRLKRPGFWLACFGLSAFSYGTLHAFAAILPRDARIRKDGDRIVVGDGEIRALILTPTGNALGASYGRELKEFMTGKGFSVLFSPAPPAENVRIAIVSSGFDQGLLSKINADKVAILNCMPISADFEEAGNAELEIIIGGMGDWRPKRYWREVAGKNPGIKLAILPGAADYIPGWTRLLDGSFELQTESACE